MVTKLVLTQKHYLVVYGTPEAAEDARIVFDTEEQGAMAVASASDFPSSAQHAANYWSKKLDAQVWYSELGDVFLVLEDDMQRNLYKVLHGERVGWIIKRSWIVLEEV